MATKLEPPASDDRSFRDIVDHSLQGIHIVSDGRLVYANRSSRRILGYEFAEMAPWSMDEHLRTLIHEDDVEFVRTKARERMAGRSADEPYEARMIRKDGQVIVAELWPRVSTFEGRPAVVTAFVDVSAQRLALAAIVESRTRFHEALDHLPEPFVMYDADLRIRFINRAAIRALGCESEDSFLGRRDADVLPPAMARLYTPLLEAAVTTGHPQEAELTLPLPTGERMARIRCIPLLASSGRMTAALMTAVDVKAYRALEEALSRKTIALEELVATVQAARDEARRHVVRQVDDVLRPLVLRLQRHSLPSKGPLFDVLLDELTRLTDESSQTHSCRLLQRLSLREIEIADMVDRGMQSKQIAMALNISLRTVDNHRSRIRRKLGLTGTGRSIGSALADRTTHEH